MRDGGMTAQNAPANWYSLVVDQLHESSESTTFTFRAAAPQYACYVFRNSGASHVSCTWAATAEKLILDALIAIHDLVLRRRVPVVSLMLS